MGVHFKLLRDAMGQALNGAREKRAMTAGKKNQKKISFLFDIVFFLYLCALIFLYKMESLELYTVLFKGLSLGSHEFDWKIDDKFFAMYEMSEISDAGVDVRLTLLKRSDFMELRFVLDGWVEVACSRCLDPLKLDLASEAKMYVKFGSHSDEDDSEENDVIILPYGEDRLNVAQYLYEYAHLSLPIRRVHPDDDATGQSSCNAEMIKKLEQFLVKTNNT